MKKENFENIIFQALARAEKQRAGKIDKMARRKDCLSDETICYYVESLLSNAEREKAEEHLFECPFCLESVIDVVKSKELEQLETSEAIEKKESNIKAQAGLGEVIDGVIKPLKICLAWVGEHLTLKETEAEYIPFWNDLKPVLVRGGSNKKALSLPTFSKTYGNYKVKVRVTEEAERRCGIQLKVFLLSEKKEGVRIKAELLKEGRILRSFFLEKDSIQFQGILPGDYMINIWDGKRFIADIAIKIKNR